MTITKKIRDYVSVPFPKEVQLKHSNKEKPTLYEEEISRRGVKGVITRKI